jgi:hypothetical protein
VDSVLRVRTGERGRDAVRGSLAVTTGSPRIAGDLAAVENLRRHLLEAPTQERKPSAA